MDDSLIDCDAGRRLGCSTFCCRLLVRFYEDERPPGKDGATAKGCVDKAPDGFCIHLDRRAHRCDIWETRPRVCREYDCNSDYLLQAAVRLGVKNIVQLSRDAQKTPIPKADWIKVPARGCADEPVNREKSND
jgi:hypothetical protein